jgi:hypothetical protein
MITPLMYYNIVIIRNDGQQRVRGRCALGDAYKQPPNGMTRQPSGNTSSAVWISNFEIHGSKRAHYQKWN